MNISEAIGAFAGLVWGPALMILLVGTGLYLTARTGCIQFRGLAHGFKILRGHYDRHDAGLNLTQAAEVLGISSKRRLQQLVDELERARLVRTRKLQQRGQPRVIEPIPSREVDSFRQYAYRKFYFRRQALSRLFAMLEPASAGNIFMNLKSFIQWIKG